MAEYHNGYEVENGNRVFNGHSNDGETAFYCNNGFCREFLASGYEAEYYCDRCEFCEAVAENDETEPECMNFGGCAGNPL